MGNPARAETAVGASTQASRKQPRDNVRFMAIDSVRQSEGLRYGSRPYCKRFCTYLKILLFFCGICLRDPLDFPP